MIKIREYTNDDCSAVSRLFYETVHSVNAKDYTIQQLFAWARSSDSLSVRSGELIKQHTLVATIGGTIVGFGSIDGSGHLDMLFVQKDYLRQGIATALCNELEEGFSTVTTYASITAKPFFERRGYRVVKERTVERDGEKLTNFEMRKTRNGRFD